MKRSIFCLLMFVLLAGCSSGERTAPGGGPALKELAGTPRGAAQYLAYEHSATVETEEGKVRPLLERLSAACKADVENDCTLLRSSAEAGRYEHAALRVRIKAPGVGKLLALASAGGELAQQETSVEDLALPVSDSNKRLDMLRSYQRKLLELERKGGANVDSLIKLSRELASVQTELEQAEGEHRHLMQRVNHDILNIAITSQQRQGFWTPIRRAATEFGGNLSSGIAQTVTGIANMLPWIVLLMVIWLPARKLWRKMWKRMTVFSDDSVSRG